MRKKGVILVIAVLMILFTNHMFSAAEPKTVDVDRQKITFTLKEDKTIEKKKVKPTKKVSPKKILPKTNEQRALFLSFIGTVLTGICCAMIYNKQKGRR
ncbi:LPXTG cell wall anchor domain-containing protein [Vagococcus acidifermentans]|uniref:Gram-positive cocci surface proteins LPxTG domain-containing protein n=1 Tax=Vagococcus acidifermentans TaxID=564710 RepID=A0A430B2W6_9ENTE|nr:LPXTG cell wall anchor domain-containing protein [Vagococcus acidifermentans]RSU14685.1 hypothetical protein CBF27_01525 [Vagococcus acidifermentans]